MASNNIDISDLPPPPKGGSPDISDLPAPPAELKAALGSAPPQGSDSFHLSHHSIPGFVLGKMADFVRDKLNEEGKQDRSGQALAGLEHYGNVPTLGYLPHLQAKAEPVTDRLFNALGVGDVNPAPMSQLEENGPEYLQARDQNINRMKQEGKEFPLASLSGSGFGIGASMLMNPSGAANAATGLGRTLQSASIGAGYGLAANPGDVPGQVDDVQLGDRAKNAAKGFGLGALLQGGAELLKGFGGNGTNGASGTLKDLAEEKAFKVAGPSKKDFELAQAQGKVGKYGRAMLDEGVVTPFTSTAKAADRLTSLKDDAGARIGDIIEQAEMSGASPISARDIALKLSENPEIQALSKTPGKEGTARQVENYLNTLYSNGDNLSLGQAQKLRQGIDDSINFNKRVPEMSGAQPYLYEMRDAIRNNVNDTINAMSPGGNYNQLRDANQRYHILSSLERMADKKSAGDAANRAIGLTDTISGGAGAGVGTAIGSMGGPHMAEVGAAVGGAMGAGLNKLGRTYGNSLMATSADALSKVLANSPKLAEALQQHPEAAPLLMNMLHRQNNPSPEQPMISPQVLGLLKQNPALLDRIQNEDLKKTLKEKLNRKPADGVPAQDPIHPEDAKKQFLDGN